jgi:thymidylate synthase (FAD)
MDSRFRVSLIAATPRPQQCVYAAMHQDYSEDLVALERAAWPHEHRAGEVCVKRLLGGERGHYGPLEHPQITLNAGWFPHSVMQQARTHRVGVSFDVQSGRYTSTRILDVAADIRSVEDVFYVRSSGRYTDRKGAHYDYTPEQRTIDLARCRDAAAHYAGQIRAGMSEEHARSMIPFDIRQHFIVSFNLRSLMHFLDLRSKLDAQLEIRQLCDLIWPHFQTWAPQIAEWYLHHRMGKARLAP